jgi:hypothetical protein
MCKKSREHTTSPVKAIAIESCLVLIRFMEGNGLRFVELDRVIKGKNRIIMSERSLWSV